MSDLFPLPPPIAPTPTFPGGAGGPPPPIATPPIRPLGAVEGPGPIGTELPFREAIGAGPR